MASGGSASPAPAARRTIPPTRSRRRHARTRNAVAIPTRPWTATWLPPRARRAALGAPSSVKGERQESARPHPRGEQVDAVRGGRERGGRLHGGGVAGGRDGHEGGSAEQRRLASRRSPVRAPLHVEAQGEKRREQHEDTVADE